jgi:hypothetical protein
MNFEFIEGGETRDKVVKFGWVGITDEEVVNNKGKRGGVGVMAEEHEGIQGGRWWWQTQRR